MNLRKLSVCLDFLIGEISDFARSRLAIAHLLRNILFLLLDVIVEVFPMELKVHFVLALDLAACAQGS